MERRKRATIEIVSEGLKVLRTYGIAIPDEIIRERANNITGALEGLGLIVSEDSFISSEQEYLELENKKQDRKV
jgi:hypothetical protein